MANDPNNPTQREILERTMARRSSPPRDESLREDLERAHDQHSRPTGGAPAADEPPIQQSHEGPLPKNWNEAASQVIWGVLILGWGLELIISVLDGHWGRAFFALVGLLMFLAMLIHGEEIKQRLLAINPNWIFAAALIFLFGLILSPFVEEKRWPLSVWFQSSGPAVVIHDPPTAEDIARTAEPIRRQLNDATQERDAARSDVANFKSQLESKQHDLEVAQQALEKERGFKGTIPPSTPPVERPKSTMNAEEIATRIEVWQTIDDKMNTLAGVINQGQTILDLWANRMKSERPTVIPAFDQFNRSLTSVKNELETLRKSYPDYADVADSLKETAYVRAPVPVTIFDKLLHSMQALWNELQNMPDPPPQNYVDSMRAYTGAFRRDLAILSAWQSTTRSRAKAKQKELLDMGSK